MRTQAALTDRERDASPNSLGFGQGCKSAVPIAVGYIPIAIAFGLLAKSSGVPNYISVMMSFFIFAGASQFVGANLLAVGATYGEIILTTFILNLRHFLMTASIAQRVDQGTSKKWMALLAFGVTDETFTVAALRKESRLPKEFVFGLNITSFAAWNAGTWVGVFLAAGLPASVQESMGIALYAMFIGLLVPSLRTSRPVLIVCILSVAIHSLLYWVPVFAGLSTGWRIIISTILAAGAGAVLFSEEGNES
ncbi:AzlC family ABC transporter permease [Aneurinibacillus tyrosinisolvens]|uniref:AzlC family ABC transporter permease n=1 Tax=Aneurinibacillus tyrosinisolvens TaxID=1443435 RepID=UPI00063F63C8|nr:AzlC family ABC transporter permease [Aneurinibacillus tyrosinisolvens]